MKLSEKEEQALERFKMSLTEVLNDNLFQDFNE
jgi:hypothetical protein